MKAFFQTPLCLLFIFINVTLSAQIKGDIDLPFNNFQELDEHLRYQASSNKFSGVVLITEKYQPIFHKVYGLASKRFDIPNELDTKFNIGSIGKLFTSIAIMQLWQEKKLSLDDVIGKYLPQFPSVVGDNVTIRHLLEHKSGWGHYWKNTYYLQNWYDLRKIDDYIVFIKDIPLEFTPGTKQQNSNIGYEVLGAIIEKVSGIDYHQYIEEKISKPAQMFNTGAYDFNVPVKNLAIGYTNMSDFSEEGFKRNNIGLTSLKGTSGGGIYSTAEDLLKLLRTLRNGTLIPEQYTNFIMKSFKGSLPDTKELGYVKTFSGGGPGVSAMIFDRGGEAFIVLSNYDHPVALDLHNSIVKMMMINKSKSAGGKISIKN